MLRISSVCATIASLSCLVSAAVYGSIDELPTTEFDFIVIGGKCQNKLLCQLTEQNMRIGGTAGPVVANRLTERADFDVLVIEAGPTYFKSNGANCTAVQGVK